VTSTARAWLATALLLALMRPADALSYRPVLHEPIPPDPREDLAMHVALDGELPAAIQTPGGVVGAPDPRQLPSPTEATYGQSAPHDSFVPDRDTRRPDVGAYDDPFTPSTAPFKRLDAYDAVHPDYRLYVRDERLVPLVTGGPPVRDEEAFYADVVVDFAPDTLVRIPSVGPGARIVRARLGLGADDLGFRVFHDGADNWFLQPSQSGQPGARAASMRARLVMEVAVPRAAFGGPVGDPSWGDLIVFPPLPENVARDAAELCGALGLSHKMRPRAVVAKLVQYFRSFVDSDDPPQGRGSVYLDLALSKKGVCRHRAFAFLVTAQSLGIPTRVVMNEAHAWVEVHDGTLWRRIDLGGAGRMTSPDPSADRAAYTPPPDVFTWPRGSVRGDDMIADAHARAVSASGSAAAGAGGPPQSSAAAQAPGVTSASPAAPIAGDDHPLSDVSFSVMASDAHRGQPLPVRGTVRADGEACAHVAVELSLRDPKTRSSVLLGTLATGDDGSFAGAIVVPGSTPVGDYDVVARTLPDARCGGRAF